MYIQNFKQQIYMHQIIQIMLILCHPVTKMYNHLLIKT